MSRTDFKNHFNWERLMNYKVIPFFKLVELQFSNDNLYTIKFWKSFNDKEYAEITVIEAAKAMS